MRQQADYVDHLLYATMGPVLWSFWIGPAIGIAQTFMWLDYGRWPAWTLQSFIQWLGYRITFAPLDKIADELPLAVAALLLSGALIATQLLAWEWNEKRA